jgi:transposase
MGNTFRLLREVLMPWKESSVMEERLRFVARLLDGEGMSDVCRAFGISRKTGYKIFNRYKEHGLEALTDRSRRPVRYANQLPHQVEQMIVRFKRDKPHWGARTIRELLTLGTWHEEKSGDLQDYFSFTPGSTRTRTRFVHLS